MKTDGTPIIKNRQCVGQGTVRVEWYRKVPRKPKVALEEPWAKDFTREDGIVADGTKVYGRIGFAKGVTLSLGNFEMVRVDVWTDMPCWPTPEGRDSMHRANVDWVEEKLDETTERYMGGKQ